MDGQSVYKDETNDALSKTYRHQGKMLAALRGSTGWHSFLAKTDVIPQRLNQ